MIPTLQCPRGPLMIATCGLLVLAACDEPLDFDLRGLGGGFTTAQAAQNATADRPAPDNRGVISYPNYQVAVARRGDTLQDVATRVGLPASELAKFNGVETDVPLRDGEIIALPRRVSEPSPSTGAVQPSSVDVTTLAGNAIDNAAPTPVANSTTSTSQPQTGQEPIRHRVERGETAFTIARLYQVPAKSLAEWNGLNADFAVREGQYLLIPVARTNAPERNAPAPAATTAPGAGSPTPLPPRFRQTIAGRRHRNRSGGDTSPRQTSCGCWANQRPHPTERDVPPGSGINHPGLCQGPQ